MGNSDEAVFAQVMQPISEASIPEGVTEYVMQQYEKGSKSALNKLRKSLLAVLCSVKFGRNCDNMKKKELLDQIYEAASHYFSPQNGSD